MAALTRPRVTQYRAIEQLALPVAAATTIYEGAILQRSGGLLIPATSGTVGDEDLQVAGVADETVDNTGGAAGAKRCLVRLPHNSLFLIATNADLAHANIGSVYDVLDDQTLQAAADDAAPGGRLVAIEAARLGWFDLFDTFTRP